MQDGAVEFNAMLEGLGNGELRGRAASTARNMNDEMRMVEGPWERAKGWLIFATANHVSSPPRDANARAPANRTNRE